MRERAPNVRTKKLDSIFFKTHQVYRKQTKNVQTTTKKMVRHMLFQAHCCSAYSNTISADSHTIAADINNISADINNT